MCSSFQWVVQSSLWLRWRRFSLLPGKRTASPPSQDRSNLVSASTQVQRETCSPSGRINVGGSVVPFRKSVKHTFVSLCRRTLLMDRLVTEVVSSSAPNISVHFDTSELCCQSTTPRWLLTLREETEHIFRQSVAEDTIFCTVLVGPAH